MTTFAFALQRSLLFYFCVIQRQFKWSSSKRPQLSGLCDTQEVGFVGTKWSQVHREFGVHSFGKQADLVGLNALAGKELTT